MGNTPLVSLKIEEIYMYERKTTGPLPEDSTAEAPEALEEMVVNPTESGLSQGMSETVNLPDACVDHSGFEKPTSLHGHLLESPDQGIHKKMTQASQETADVLDSLMHPNPKNQRSNVATQESETVNLPDACVDQSGFDKPPSLLRQLLESPDQDKPKKMTQETANVLDPLMHPNSSDQRLNVATQESETVNPPCTHTRILRYSSWKITEENRRKQKSPGKLLKETDTRTIQRPSPYPTIQRPSRSIQEQQHYANLFNSFQ